MTITVRPATTEDLPAIAAMAEHFIASTTYREEIPSDPAHIWTAAAQVLNLGVIFLAERDGAIIGMFAGLVFPHFLTSRRTASEQWWWVEPQARGGEAADLLLEAFEGWARAQGATRSELGSRHAVLDRFYRKRGYRAVERLHVKDLTP